MDYRVRLVALLIAIVAAGFALLMLTVLATDSALGERQVGVRPSQGRAVHPGSRTAAARTERLDRPGSDEPSEEIPWEDVPTHSQVMLSAVQGTVLDGLLHGCLVPHLPEQFTPVGLEWTTWTGRQGLTRVEIATPLELSDRGRACLEDRLWTAPWVRIDADGHLRQRGSIALAPAAKWRVDPTRELDRLLEDVQVTLDGLEGRLAPAHEK